MSKDLLQVVRDGKWEGIGGPGWGAEKSNVLCLLLSTSRRDLCLRQPLVPTTELPNFSPSERARFSPTPNLNMMALYQGTIFWITSAKLAAYFAQPSPSTIYEINPVNSDSFRG